jgi:hypothetical protein
MITEMVEISPQTVEIISPPWAKYLHQKSQEMTLILRKVEISEVVEIFSDYLVTDIFYD